MWLTLTLEGALKLFLSPTIVAFSDSSGVMLTEDIWCVLASAVWKVPELTFLNFNWIVLCHQTLAMYLWAWKTRGSQTERFLLLHIITITWHLGTEDWTTAGHGACDIVTTDSGYRSICRKSTEWKALLLKADRMPISGSRAILCLMAWTVWISLITKRMEELR